MMAVEVHGVILVHVSLCMRACNYKEVGTCSYMYVERSDQWPCCRGGDGRSME